MQDIYIPDIEHLAQLIIDQTECTLPAAITSIITTKGDVVEAILLIMKQHAY